MHCYCIRVTALLEYFEWTLSKQHSRSKGKGLCLFFNHANDWGRLIMLISYLGSIIDTQLAELNKDGNSYKIKKPRKDSAVGQVDCFPCTDNYRDNTSQNSPLENNHKLLSIINNLNNSNNASHILLMGNSNLPSINWSEYSYLSCESSLAHFSWMLSRTAFWLNMYLNVSGTCRDGQQLSLLDLVFSSDPSSINQITNLSGLGSSDHDCLLWKYKCYGNPPVIKDNTYIGKEITAVWIIILRQLTGHKSWVVMAFRSTGTFKTTS